MDGMIESGALAPAWGALVERCRRRGRRVPTEYGESSFDLSPGGAVVRRALAQPLVHLGNVAWNKRGEYTAEVLDGTANDRIGVDWDYTYHERLFVRPYGDQIEWIAMRLADTAYTRRAMAITWWPENDQGSEGPPCLQRVWCRVVGGSLEMHTYWRSRDLWNAWWLNAYAMMKMQDRIRRQVMGLTGRRLELGRYVDISSSLHIYERNWGQVDRFLATVERRGEETLYRDDLE